MDEDNEDDGNNKGKRRDVRMLCACFLDALDSNLLVAYDADDNGGRGGRTSMSMQTRKGGLFRLLLRLLCGPALPGMGTAGGTPFRQQPLCWH
jgi:hypothetical protein